MSDTPSPETLARARDKAVERICATQFHSNRAVALSWIAAISQPLQQQIETLEKRLSKRESDYEELLERSMKLVSEWREDAAFLRKHADFADANGFTSQADVADAVAKRADELEAALASPTEATAPRETKESQ